MNDPITVSVIHVFKVDNNVVLRCHVISDIMINYQSKQSVQKSQVDLLVHLLESGF